LLNCIIKLLVHRVRPPYQLQIGGIHPDSFSYVSSHSLIVFCLWGVVIYFINKYVENKKIKTILFSLSIFWILFVGFSRIWLGVHNPSDVIGAYILGLCLLSVYSLKRWV
jgi:undecaprenyl-diphosphatase